MCSAILIYSSGEHDGAHARAILLARNPQINSILLTKDFVNSDFAATN